MEPTDPKQPTGSQPATGEQPTVPTTGSQPVIQTPQEQIDGLRAWVAQLDRRLGARSIAGGWSQPNGVGTSESDSGITVWLM